MTPPSFDVWYDAEDDMIFVVSSREYDLHDHIIARRDQYFYVGVL